MGESPVHVFIRRSAEYGGRVGPYALGAAVTGFVLWLLAADASPAIGGIGWLVGVGGMLAALCAALASGVGLLAPGHRSLAARGLVTGALGVLIPAALALAVMTFLWA
jgi:hypothetical protein